MVQIRQEDGVLIPSRDVKADEQVRPLIPASSSGVVYEFRHAGILPGTTVTVPTAGVFDDNESLYCYYVNEAENRLELADETAAVGGYASFTIDHCSKYVLLDTKIDGAVIETETDTAEESAADSSAPSTGDPVNPVFYAGFAAGAAILAGAAWKLFGRKQERRNKTNL